nr:ribonuclease H-like domain-containing protein [Tanacetum cinerariifolium]
VEKILKDVRADDIKIIPVDNKNEFASFVVVATGKSQWHVRNIAQALIYKYSIDHQPPVIQEDLNQKLISYEFMIEQRNELFKAMQSMFEEFRQRKQASNLSTHTSKPLRRFNSICYDDDDDDDDEERTIHLHPKDSLIIRNKDLSTIPKKESDEFIKSSVEDLDLIPSESEDTSESDSECDLSACENNFISGNPTPSSDSEVESLSPTPIPYDESDPLLEETDILLSHFDNSSPEYETFSFDVEEKSSGSTTSHSDYSLSDYEAFYFYDDHIEEKSSGSNTTHSDFSLPEYDLFIFDLSIDPFPPADRSVFHHEEFADELTYIISSPEYAVPTGRVIVLADRYIVPTSSVIIATGRYIVPTEEHLAVQRESKARTTLLQSIPNDHIADFHYMDDARDIWNAVKARFGGNAKSKKMRKSMLKQEFLECRISEAEGLHKGYDRMQKILSQLNQLDAKLDAEEINLRGYSNFSPSQSAGPSHTAFVSATSTSKMMPYGDSLISSSPTTYFVPSNSKTGSHKSSNVIKDVLHLFFVDSEPEQQLDYEDLKLVDKLDLEEIDLKWQMAMLSVRVHKFEQKARRKIDFDRKESASSKGGNNKQRYSPFKNKEIGRKEEDSKALIYVDTLVDWSNHDSKCDEVIAAKEFGMIAGCDSADAIKAGANKLYNMINGANSEEANTPGDAGEFALMGVTSEKINANCEMAKKDLQTQLYNHFVQTEKWKTSSKNLYKLIDSSMSVRTKVGLGFTDCIRKNELGWDDSAFSVFTTTFEDVEGRPAFYRFAKTDSMKVMPPPLTGDYTSLSDHSNLDESQMSYGTNSSTSCDPKSVTNDSVSCDNSEKSSKDNINDLASSDSGLKSLEHKSTDSSCASTSSGSTSVNGAEIDSHVRTPTKEPISVQDFPSFACHSSNKNEHSSRTFCNKHGSFNKKAGHFRKYSSFVSKLCFVCGSGTHLIKDCDFYKKQMTNTTVAIGVGPAVRPQPVPTGKPKAKPVPTGTPKATPVHTGKPKGTPVPTGKPTVHPVPTGQPKFTPVLTGRLVPTGKPKAKPVPTGTPKATPVHTGKPKGTPVLL